MANWNPWHGCHKISAGCQHCYVYRSDAKYGKDSSIVKKNTNFYLPIQKNRKGEYKIPAGEIVYTCFTSDFFVEDADEWRKEAWDMIRERNDLHFFFITKRIHRFMECIPDDWGEGYDHVTISCTVENQERCDFRLPIYKQVPIKHKQIVCEPLLSDIDLSQYLDDTIELVLAGGESGLEARTCDFHWVMHLREQALQKDLTFHFKQTGANFLKDGILYRVPRKYQHIQARKANINYYNERTPSVLFLPNRIRIEDNIDKT